MNEFKRSPAAGFQHGLKGSPIAHAASQCRYHPKGVPVLRRVLIAIVISLVANVSLFVLDLVVRPGSMIGEIIDVVFKPGEVFATAFLSPGHDFAPLVGIALLAFAFSIIFYGFLAWTILNVPDWWRNLPWNFRNNNRDWF